jgi:hypothetical protein
MAAPNKHFELKNNKSQQCDIFYFTKYFAVFKQKIEIFAFKVFIFLPRTPLLPGDCTTCLHLAVPLQQPGLCCV